MPATRPQMRDRHGLAAQQQTRGGFTVGEHLAAPALPLGIATLPVPAAGLRYTRHGSPLRAVTRGDRRLEPTAVWRAACADRIDALCRARGG